MACTQRVTNGESEGGAGEGHGGEGGSCAQESVAAVPQADRRDAVDSDQHVGRGVCGPEERVVDGAYQKMGTVRPHLCEGGVWFGALLTASQKGLVNHQGRHVLVDSVVGDQPDPTVGNVYVVGQEVDLNFGEDCASRADGALELASCDMRGEGSGPADFQLELSERDTEATSNKGAVRVHHILGSTEVLQPLIVVKVDRGEFFLGGPGRPGLPNGHSPDVGVSHTAVIGFKPVHVVHEPFSSVDVVGPELHELVERRNKLSDRGVVVDHCPSHCWWSPDGLVNNGKVDAPCRPSCLVELNDLGVVGEGSPQLVGGMGLPGEGGVGVGNGDPHV